MLLLVRHPAIDGPHYYTYVLPGQYVVIAVALTSVAGKLQALGQSVRLPGKPLAVTVIAACLALLAASQVVYFRAYLDNVVQAGPQRPYGTPLIYSERAVDTVRDLSRDLGEPDVFVYGSIHRFALDYLARPDLRLRNVDPPLAVVLPRSPGHGCLAVLAADDAILAVDDYHATDDNGPVIPLLREMGFAELADRAVHGPDGFTYFRFFYQPPDKSISLAGAFVSPERSLDLPNGMRLAGYSLSPTALPDGKLDLRLLWDLPPDHSLYPYGEFNLFLHAVDASGKTVAQRDWPLLQYQGWHIADFVVTHHELSVPSTLVGPSLLWLDVGAYERFGRQAVPVRGVAEGENREALRLGPVKVRQSGVLPPPRSPATLKFGAWLELAGYDLTTTAGAAGSTMEVGSTLAGAGRAGRRLCGLGAAVGRSGQPRRAARLPARQRALPHALLGDGRSRAGRAQGATPCAGGSGVVRPDACGVRRRQWPATTGERRRPRVVGQDRRRLTVPALLFGER